MSVRTTGGIIAVSGFALAMAGFYWSTLTGPSFALARSFAAVSPEVVGKIGAVKTVVLIPLVERGHYSSESAREDLVCEVFGALGSGMLQVAMHRGSGDWYITSASFKGQRLQIPAQYGASES
jgi:hypothetical protein